MMQENGFEFQTTPEAPSQGYGLSWWVKVKETKEIGYVLLGADKDQKCVVWIRGFYYFVGQNDFDYLKIVNFKDIPINGYFYTGDVLYKKRENLELIPIKILKNGTMVERNPVLYYSTHYTTCYAVTLNKRLQIYANR